MGSVDLNKAKLFDDEFIELILITARDQLCEHRHVEVGKASLDDIIHSVRFSTIVHLNLELGIAKAYGQAFYEDLK